MTGSLHCPPHLHIMRCSIVKVFGSPFGVVLSDPKLLHDVIKHCRSIACCKQSTVESQ